MTGKEVIVSKPSALTEIWKSAFTQPIDLCTQDIIDHLRPKVVNAIKEFALYSPNFHKNETPQQSGRRTQKLEICDYGRGIRVEDKPKTRLAARALCAELNANPESSKFYVTFEIKDEGTTDLIENYLTFRIVLEMGVKTKETTETVTVKTEDECSKWREGFENLNVLYNELQIKYSALLETQEPEKKRKK